MAEKTENTAEQAENEVAAEKEAETKAPKKEKKSKKDAEIEKLKEDLKLAVKEQRFEDAAVIRDKIKDLTQEG